MTEADPDAIGPDGTGRLPGSKGLPSDASPPMTGGQGNGS